MSCDLSWCHHVILGGFGRKESFCSTDHHHRVTKKILPSSKSCTRTWSGMVRVRCCKRVRFLEVLGADTFFFFVWLLWFWGENPNFSGIFVFVSFGDRKAKDLSGCFGAKRPNEKKVSWRPPNDSITNIGSCKVPQIITIWFTNRGLSPQKNRLFGLF